MRSGRQGLLAGWACWLAFMMARGLVWQRAWLRVCPSHRLQGTATFSRTCRLSSSSSPHTACPACAEGEMGHSAGSAPPGAVVVYANELEFFGDVSTGNIKRWGPLLISLGLLGCGL